MKKIHELLFDKKNGQLAKVRSSFKKRNLPISVVQNWGKIGGELSDIYSPVKISKYADGDTLYVRAKSQSSYNHFIYHHHKLLLSINSYYGYQCITKVRLMSNC